MAKERFKPSRSSLYKDTKALTSCAHHPKQSNTAIFFSSSTTLSHMALSSNFISFIFFTTLLLPLQINARESQFFSKVTNVNNNKEATVLPNKEETVNKPEQQQQPAFIPETENSYGLYGHEESNTPFTKTTPTTNYQPYKTTTEFEDKNKYNNNKYYNYDNNDNAYYNTNNQNEFSNTRLTGTGYYSSNNNYNKDAFGNGYQNELSDTKYTEDSGYNSMEYQNNNNQMYYNNNNNERYTYNNNNNNANNRYNGERQGMSDTRFMEGGNYYYDVYSEKHKTPLHGDAYRGLNNDNWYNNNNNYNHGNYNEYQNQENFEEEP